MNKCREPERLILAEDSEHSGMALSKIEPNVTGSGVTDCDHSDVNTILAAERSNLHGGNALIDCSGFRYSMRFMPLYVETVAE